MSIYDDYHDVDIYEEEDYEDDGISPDSDVEDEDDDYNDLAWEVA